MSRGTGPAHCTAASLWSRNLLLNWITNCQLWCEQPRTLSRHHTVCVTFFQWLHFSSSWIHVVVFRVDRRYHSVDVLTKMFDLVYSRVPGDLSITGHSLRANIIITDGAFHHWALSSQSVESIWAQIMIGLGPVLVIVASRNKDYVL